MLVLNGTVFIKGQFLKKDIRIENGRFAELIEPGRECLIGKGTLAEEIVDATNRYILPGLVDVHTHGRLGEDFSRLTDEGLQKLLKSYAACGITSVLGTTMTNMPSTVEESLRVMKEHMREQRKEIKKGLVADNRHFGATLLGVHMEGPFLGKEKKGAHAGQYLQKPDWKWFGKMQEASGKNIRLITIDPTLSGAEELIKKSVDNDVRVSLGHTVCNYETGVRAQKMGADHITHIFNAMNPLHHREPGLIGAAMDTGMYMELICDGIHVHPAMVRLLFAAHPDKVVLVSDSIPAAGMSDGEYESGGLKVMLQNGRATLVDGTIAGSAISLFDAMVNAIKFGVPEALAVNSATYIPAKTIGLEQVTGSIAVGRKADFLVTDDEWHLEKVYIGGKSIAN